MPKKKRQPSRPKLQNPVEDARRHLRSGAYRDTIHYETRRGERGVTQDEVMQVIETGRHEKRKDEYKEEYRAWNYAKR